MNELYVPNIYPSQSFYCENGDCIWNGVVDFK
jgi:hypothetical protein